MGGIFRKRTVRSLEVQTRIVNFIETGFTDHGIQQQITVYRETADSVSKVTYSRSMAMSLHLFFFVYLVFEDFCVCEILVCLKPFAPHKRCGWTTSSFAQNYPVWETDEAEWVWCTNSPNSNWQSSHFTHYTPPQTRTHNTTLPTKQQRLDFPAV